LGSWDTGGAALARFDRDLDSKRIVFLGEPDHRIQERYAFRLLFLRRLFAMGFRQLGSEMGRSDGRRLDRYIESGDEAWLDRVALHGYRGDTRDRGASARAPSESARAFYVEERAFARALRALSESRPPGTPRLEFFGFDVDGVVGGGYADVEKLLKPHAADAEVASLLARVRRVAGETTEAELRRLGDAWNVLDASEGPLRTSLGAADFTEVRSSLRCLGESILAHSVIDREQELSTSDADARKVVAAYARRELTMRWQVDERMTSRAGPHGDRPRMVLMGHAGHLTRDEHALREIPVWPAWTWPRLGSYLTGKWGDEVEAVWLLYGGGMHSDPDRCGSAVECPIDSRANEVGAALAQRGPLWVARTRDLPELADERSFLFNGLPVRGRIAAQADLVVFAETVHGVVPHR
jgi:erythromycin esterase-like protein